MRKWLVPLVVLSGFVSSPSADLVKAGSTKPILVELFTSEGCSSCPPADAFLQRLNQQPIAGAQLIVLSEHVDYWNHLGWKDPYSSRFFSDRQSEYARRFGLDGPYTPQMVVDGSSQFVGSNQELGNKAIGNALGSPKIDVELKSAYVEPTGVLKANVQTSSLPSSEPADVYLAVALNRAQSRVANGENSGRTLDHVSVVRSMTKVGEIRHGETFARELQVKLSAGMNEANLRVVAFVQEAHQGKVLGSATTAIAGR